MKLVLKIAAGIFLGVILLILGIPFLLGMVEYFRQLHLH